tara:strand:- start:101 stop:271 length:171 start_codon:yes stop_codon:yes gene_type:complete
MEGTIYISEDRIIKYFKNNSNVWTIKLIKDEENADSDGHTNLRKETVLQQMKYTEE